MSSVLPTPTTAARRLTTMVTALVLVLLGAWAAALFTPAGAPVRLTASSEIDAEHPALAPAMIGKESLEAAGPRAPQSNARLAALVSVALALGAIGLLLAVTQRGWADMALGGAGLLWAVYFGLGAHSGFTAPAGLAPSVAQMALLVATVLTAGYGVHLMQRRRAGTRPSALLNALLVGMGGAWLAGALGWIDPTAGWIIPLACLAGGCGLLVQAVEAARRHDTTLRPVAGSWALTVAVAIVIGCAMHEVWVRVGSPAGFGLESRQGAWFATRWAIMVLLAVLLGLRLEQLSRMLRQLGRSHRSWRSRLRHSERQLHDTHDRLTLRERHQQQGAQRDRLLRDLHDELGHRLVQAQGLAARDAAAANRTELQQLLDTSLIELRIAFAALETVPRPLADALQALRDQLTPQLEAAGVTLAWSVDTRAARLVLPAGQTLQLLRIAREALALAQRPAAVGQPGAAVFRLEVLDGETGRHLRMRFGHGAHSEVASARQDVRGAVAPGLGGSWIKLQRQATMLGAQFVVETGDTGDSVAGSPAQRTLELVMPLGAH
ncbi:MAG: hypothetical protein ABI574_01550 [Burkholderiales bacterium]